MRPPVGTVAARRRDDQRAPYAVRGSGIGAGFAGLGRAVGANPETSRPDGRTGACGRRPARSPDCVGPVEGLGGLAGEPAVVEAADMRQHSPGQFDPLQLLRGARA